MISSLVWADLLIADEPICHYDLEITRDQGIQLQVDIECPGLTEPRFGFLYRDSASFVADQRKTESGIAYRLNLTHLAARVNNYRYAQNVGGVTFATMASWLMVPRQTAEIRLRQNTPAAVPMTMALPRRHDYWVMSSTDMARSGYAVFGDFSSHMIAIDSEWQAPSRSRVEVIDLRRRQSDQDLLLDWISDTANQVARYWHGFPTDHFLLVIVDQPGTGIEYGRVMGGGGAVMLLVLGDNARVEELYSEWVLIHELLHLGTPFMANGFWFMEGMATYSEPIIRARAGWRSERSVWNEFRRDMPRGSFALSEEGLANTRRGLYWGGALFMLLADRELRAESDGEIGIEHCLREIHREFGDITHNSTAEIVMAHCDNAFNTRFFQRLAECYVHDHSPLNLAELWEALGIVVENGQVNLNDNAAQVDIRQWIVRGTGLDAAIMNDKAPDTFR